MGIKQSKICSNNYNGCDKSNSVTSSDSRDRNNNYGSINDNGDRDNNGGRNNDGCVFILDLPNEMITEILLRLPRASLFSCSLTCKSLLPLTADRSFISDYFIHSRSVCGFFFNPPRSASRFISSTKCDISITHRLEKSKHFNSGLSVLGSSNGLLLLGDPNRINRRQLVVFNPVTEQSIKVPPLSDHFSHKWGVGFVCHSILPTDFKIILVGGAAAVHTFSSKDKQWTATVGTADDNLIDEELYISNEAVSFSVKTAVYASGILYWAHGKSSVRALNIEKSHFSTIQFPAVTSSGRRSLSESEGRLKSLSVTGSELRSWVLDRNGVVWRSELGLRLNSPDFVPVGFGGTDSKVVFFMKSSRYEGYPRRKYHLFSYHLTSKRCCCSSSITSLISERELNKDHIFFSYSLDWYE